MTIHPQPCTSCTPQANRSESSHHTVHAGWYPQPVRLYSTPPEVRTHSRSTVIASQALALQGNTSGPQATVSPTRHKLRTPCGRWTATKSPTSDQACAIENLERVVGPRDLATIGLSFDISTHAANEHIDVLVWLVHVLEQRRGVGAVGAGAILGGHIGRASEREVRPRRLHLDHALRRCPSGAGHAHEGAAAVEDDDGEEAAALLHLALDLVCTHRKPG
mmetsp:Transcript_52093/g.153740  ORF Transcript_52093/g.153740 Transcript_52093/m.153740 type:complete len:220 (-) Transcript_52093:756-1415(-)